MSQTMRVGCRLLVLLTASLVCWGVGPEVWAGSKRIESKPRNYPRVPVVSKQSTVRLVETFPNPGQLAVPGGASRFSRVRYANRAGMTQTVYMLEGDLWCRNKSRKSVEVVGVLIVPMSAFHEPLTVIRRSGQSELKHLDLLVSPGTERHVRWEQEVSSPDIYEVAVIIMRVRFRDGTVWKAPSGELVDIF